MTSLDSIFKSRDITLPTKVRLVKAMVFAVVMYGCESWTVKKAEHWRIDAFALWCWRKLLRVPWPARRSNQSILKEISLGCSLEGLMLKLKLQYFGHLMRRVDSLEKTLMLGGIGGRRRRGPQRMRWLDGITDSMDTDSGGKGGQNVEWLFYWVWGFFLEWWKHPGIRQWWWLNNPVNTLKTTEMHTIKWLKRWILWYVNFKRKIINHIEDRMGVRIIIPGIKIWY